VQLFYGFILPANYNKHTTATGLIIDLDGVDNYYQICNKQSID
jgi:hypothetical protein